MRLLSGIHLFHDVVFKSEEKGGFSGVIESEKDYFCIFIHEAEAFEGVFEPVEKPHGMSFSD